MNAGGNGRYSQKDNTDHPTGFYSLGEQTVEINVSSHRSPLLRALLEGSQRCSSPPESAVASRWVWHCPPISLCSTSYCYESPATIQAFLRLLPGVVRYASAPQPWTVPGRHALGSDLQEV